MFYHFVYGLQKNRWMYFSVNESNKSFIWFNISVFFQFWLGFFWQTVITLAVSCSICEADIHINIGIVISGCKYRFIWALLCKSPKVLSLHLSIFLSIHKTTFWSPCLDYTCILSLRPLSHTSPKMSACKGCAETWNQSSLVKGHGHQPHVKSTHILIPHLGPIWMGHTSVLACG